MTKIKEKLEKFVKEHNANENILLVANEDFIDAEHLNCFWYPSCVIAEIKHKSLSIDICVSGEINFYAEGFEWNNEDGDLSAFENEKIREFVSDDEALKRKVDEGVVMLDNSNWVEAFVYNENKGYINSVILSTANVLDAVSPESLTEILKALDLDI